MAFNSKIYLAKNIKLDKNYKAVLNYSESDMLSLITNSSNLVYSAANYQFIRDTGHIIVKAPYSTCVQANYMAFQNTDYSGKYFFAFIDEVKYVSESATEIVFTVDVWSTWHDYWTAKACYVIREHVIDDSLGANLVPEGVETGEYVVNSHLSDIYNNDITVVTGSTVGPSDLENYTVNVYNGIPVPLVYCRWDTLSSLASFINLLNSNGKIDAIKTMFFAPKWLCPNTTSGSVYVDTSSAIVTKRIGITPISTLDGYTPVNKKLLTYPYCYIAMSNAVGQYNIYYQEYWTPSTAVGDLNGELIVDMIGALTPSCSIKAVPINYKGDGANVDESITIGKYPQLAWSNDLYTNWLTQNGVNIGGIKLNAYQAGIIGGTLQAGLGAASIAAGNPYGIGSALGGVSDILGTMKENYQHSIQPNGVEGSLNSGDINVAAGLNRLHSYRITITSYFASIIDHYFTRMGYKVNQVKVPNMARRQNYNYVLVASDENVAYPNNHNNICLPAPALDQINSLFRMGITIWNNHTNFGDYSVTNSITTPSA